MEARGRGAEARGAGAETTGAEATGKKGDRGGGERGGRESSSCYGAWFIELWYRRSAEVSGWRDGGEGKGRRSGCYAWEANDLRPLVLGRRERRVRELELLRCVVH